MCMPRSTTANRRGVALLEALIALTILSVAAAGALGAVAESLRSERGMIERERSMEQAHRVMKALSLLSRADLDLRLGQRELGEFLVEVQRSRQTLYRIALANTEAPEVELLVTVVYRPDPQQ